MTVYENQQVIDKRNLNKEHNGGNMVDLYNRKAKLEYWIQRINTDLSGVDKSDLLKLVEHMQDKERANLWIIRCITALISIRRQLGKSFQEVTKEDIRSFLKWMEQKNYKPSTNEKFRQILKLFFKVVYGNGETYPEQNEIVWNKYSYSINDYLLKLFKGRLDSTAFEVVLPERSEINEYEKLRNYINKKTDTKFSNVKYWLEYSFDIHKRIVSEISAPYIHASYNKMEEDCKNSIDAITKAVAFFTGISVNSSEFWNDFWYIPQSLHDFIQVHRSQGKLPDPSSTYLYGSYQSLFIEIFNFLSDQIYKTDILPIPYEGLKNKEIEMLNTSRSDFANQDYPSAINKTTSMIEIKLRDFIYSVFLLQYGDRNHRLQRIPIKLHDYINKNPIKDKRYAFEFVGNELTYLNRHQYYPILLGPGIGSDNWEHTFSHVFVGWNYVKMASYLQSFFKFNLTSAHNKVEVLRRAPHQIFMIL